MAKFTPEPWFLGLSKIRRDDVSGVAFTAHVSRTTSDEEIGANARLIAAAPDGYELIRRAVAANTCGKHLHDAMVEWLAKVDGAF